MEGILKFFRKPAPDLFLIGLLVAGADFLRTKDG